MVADACMAGHLDLGGMSTLDSPHDRRLSTKQKCQQVAPILIVKSAGIRDTLGWRMQTIGCCLSSLHATPLFVIACYSSAFAPVNMYFAPSEW